MMRSMFSGVSGLRAHQVKMDVIGNNISNVNTVGFKGSKVTFSEVFSQTVKGASGSSDSDRGGTNPQQIGLGTQVGSIDVIHSKGSSQRTDNPTDLMIDGNGFFVISDSQSGQNKFYSRAGNFNFDEAGYLVAANGFKVFGQSFDDSGNVTSEFAPVQINKSDTKAATATAAATAPVATDKSPINFNGNIDFNEPAVGSGKLFTTTFGVYDSLGKLNNVRAEFGEVQTAVAPSMTPAAPAATVSWRNVTLTPLRADGTAYNDGNTPAVNQTFSAIMCFDAAGNAIGFGNAGGTATAMTIPPAGAATAQKLTGAATMTFTLDNRMIKQNGDPNGLTVFHQYRMASDVKMDVNKGNAAGAINSFSIGQDGNVQAIYTNGQKKTLGKLKLADFDNPAGLMKVGSNMFTETPNSGAAKFGTPTAGSFGALTPGALEMSNVDLAAEFTDMITTQRGFQANSRIITTSDEILQELVNLKR